MNNTTLNDYDSQADVTLTEAIAIVKGKMANKMEPSTAKEEMADDFLREWAECFGWETAK